MQDKEEENGEYLMLEWISMFQMQKTHNEASKELFQILAIQYKGLLLALHESLHNQTLPKQYKNLQIMKTDEVWEFKGM